MPLWNVLIIVVYYVILRARIVLKTCLCKTFWLLNSFVGSKPPKFRGSPNIFLTKYQLLVFLCLLFAEKTNLWLVNQQKFSQLKLVLRSWKESKQNLVKKNIWWSTKFWLFGSHEWVNDYSTFYFEKKTCEIKKASYVLHFVDLTNFFRKFQKILLKRNMTP